MMFSIIDKFSVSFSVIYSQSYNSQIVQEFVGISTSDQIPVKDIRTTKLKGVVKTKTSKEIFSKF